MIRRLFLGCALATSLAGCDLLNQSGDAGLDAEAGETDAAPPDAGGPAPDGAAPPTSPQLSNARIGWVAGSTQAGDLTHRTTGGLPMRFEGAGITLEGRLRP
jgi:hypothetical protein